MTDFAVQRQNMVESQVRPNGITDARVIDAMARLPRELFVPEQRRTLAYMDEDVLVAITPDGSRRWMMEPMTFARLLQLAEIGPGDVVLDVGCATGYSTAVIAALAESVIAVEEDPVLAEQATARLAELGITNAAIVNAPHATGLASEAPFDIIFINGRVATLPRALLEQLKDGGRLVAVVGETAVSPALVCTRHGEAFSSRAQYDASVAPLPGFPPPVENCGIRRRAERASPLWRSSAGRNHRRHGATSA
jgi:protein-L-isoaspartate(D-aspartate) O-methyltransferase